MTTLLLGNWKSNGSFAMLEEFIRDFSVPGTIPGFEVGLSLPFHLIGAGSDFPGLVGAQNVSSYPEGAYTGEIAAAMLDDLSCDFCLVGHSERRQYFGESVSDTAEKLARLAEVGIMPVLCIGETLAQRRAGALETVLTDQLAALGVWHSEKLAVAYEPVWAIGTGVAAEVADVREAHALIRSLLAGTGIPDVPILYGGSVKPGNAASLAAVSDVDGFLVGGASQKAASFSEIAAGFCRGKTNR